MNPYDLLPSLDNNAWSYVGELVGVKSDGLCDVSYATRTLIRHSFGPYRLIRVCGSFADLSTLAADLWFTVHVRNIVSVDKAREGLALQDFDS